MAYQHKSKMKLPETVVSLKRVGCLNSELTKIESSHDIYTILKEMYDADNFEWTESSVLITLNRANRVIGWRKLSQGGVTGTLMDPRVILLYLVMDQACTFIISHNHPSGNLKPSRQDEELTQKLKQSSALFDVKLLDHVIVSSEGYYSFADEGIL
jgi:DNA repair protein RadC